MITINEEKLLKKLEELWGNRPCPMCGNNQWIASKELYTPILISQEGAIDIGTRMLPMIPIMCSHCGNTIFVNGKHIGCIEESTNTKDGNGNAKE